MFCFPEVTFLTKVPQVSVIGQTAIKLLTSGTEQPDVQVYMYMCPDTDTSRCTRHGQTGQTVLSDAEQWHAKLQK
jgi:hypothetical protein